jgi:hypothetical protein
MAKQQVVNTNVISTDLLELERRYLRELLLTTLNVLSFESLGKVVIIPCLIRRSELVQKYIGEGSRMVRELFVMAREHAPSIIFMDEIDSIGSSRMNSTRGDSEVQRTMLELLNQLDGFESTKDIKVYYLLLLLTKRSSWLRTELIS